MGKMNWFCEEQTPGLKLCFKYRELLHSEETPYQKIEVYDTEEYGRILLLDGKVMLTEKDGFIYHEMLVHPAMGYLKKREKVVIIGGGDGGSLKEVLKYPVKEVYVVEIDRRVVEVSKKYLSFLASSFDDPRVKVFYEDGYKWLKEREDKFDLVIVDSTDPIGPAEILFSDEFLKVVSEKSFLYVTQSESPFLHVDFLRDFLKRVKKYFPYPLVYLAWIPTYPSGMWSFVMGRKRDTDIPDSPPPGLRYYTPRLFEASRVLPVFVWKRLYSP